MNRLERNVNKLRKYPNWVLSFALGWAIKFVGTAGCRFSIVTKERVVVSLRNKRKVQNHVKQVHAAAMVLLAETAAGVVLGMNLPDDRVQLVRGIDSSFVGHSKGKVKADAWLTPQQIEQIHTQEKGELTINVKVTDEAGEEPLVCQTQWAWIPKSKKQ